MASADRSKVASLYTRILLHDLPTHNPHLPPLNVDIINTILSFLGLDAISLNKLHHLPSSLLACLDGLPAMDIHPAETPPRDGKCPFMTLPTELRRAIFADSLPARDVAIPVRCEDAHDHRAQKQSSRENNHSGGEGNLTYASTCTTTTTTTTTTPAPSGSAGPSTNPAKRNRTADLMTLNRRLCAEITELLYTEREFVVHVHEGFQRGGIEFLNSGRQPLQYYCLPSSNDYEGYDDDDGCGGGGSGEEGGGPRGGGGGGERGEMKDPRFAGKFHSRAPFGLDRVKKVRVEVLPPTLPSPSSSSSSGKEGEEQEEEEAANGRMVSMNTYFMVLALVRLLERAEGPGRDRRITRLTVSFADRRRRRRRERNDQEDNTSTTTTTSSSSSSLDSSWWWDPHRSRPRETTFHGTSNLQLILLPFSRLRADQVEILLPPSCAAQLASDPATRSFLRRLEGKIMGLSSSSLAVAGSDDLLDEGKVLRNLETARFAYEAFVFRVKFGSGKGGEEVGLLGEGDWEGEKGEGIVAGDEEERKEHGEVSEGDRPVKGQREKKTKKEKKREKKERSKEKKKKNRKEKNIKGERWVGSGDADDGEDDEPEMQWALQQSLAQAAGEEEEELQQAIRESLGYDGEESAESARIDDRDRRDCAGVNEGRGEMGFEDDEFNMGLSEGIDEFSFEDEDDDGEESEEMGEADSHEHELHEGGENIMEDYDSEPKENDATGLSADMETTDPGDVEEYRHGYYEGTEEGRAKARESGSGRKAKKNSHTRLPLTELFGTTGQMTADIWQVTGTTSINSSTTSPVGTRFG
ncbi:hypothetical protein KC354_g228 [Hortaea werneckii]|nr:hypothetical protein KC354_g228 [Hortaea werneckii]